MTAHRRQAAALKSTLIIRIAVLIVWIATLPFLHGEAAAYNPYYDGFTQISARPLSMGGAAASQTGDPSAVFHNPACIGGHKKLALMHNHSGRHFPVGMEAYGGVPGKKRFDVDHLDGDTQAIIVPLFPAFTLGLGFNFQGEMGYDYRPLANVAGNKFPVERLAMVERVEALGFSLSPWTQTGWSRRSFFHFYERHGAANTTVRYPPVHPADFDPGAAFKWNRVGEGSASGVRQMLAPGVCFGAAKSKTDFDYEDGASGRYDRRKTGYSIKPAGWLTLIWDKESQIAVFFDGSGELSQQMPANAEVINGFGWELNVAGIARLRGGSLAGNGTLGAEMTLGNLRLLYTEAINYLPRILGADPGTMRNVHIYGFTLSLP